MFELKQPIQINELRTESKLLKTTYLLPKYSKNIDHIAIAVTDL